jgi:putative flavoprotein involved in K+ transport
MGEIPHAVPHPDGGEARSGLQTDPSSFVHVRAALTWADQGDVIMQKNNKWDVIVIGGGQAGLSVGYHLKRRGISFCILDAEARVGDVWRKRWDSLRLFTPARFDALDGMPFPAPEDSFPTKDEMADYLERYAAHFELPVLGGVRVTRVNQGHAGFVIAAGSRTFEAPQVIVAMSNYQNPHIPGFSKDISPDVRQLHSLNYRNPQQLKPGSVLLVGAGNTGSELALELSRTHRVYMSGRDTGHLPFRIAGYLGRVLLVRLVLRFVFHRILTIKTAIGRKARPSIVSKGGPLIRIKPRDLKRAGVERLPKTIGFDGRCAKLENDRSVAVDNVIWCTGFESGLSWLAVPAFDQNGRVRHEGGVARDVPGLFFVGRHFLYSLSSGMIHGVGRDAKRISELILAHTEQRSIEFDRAPQRETMKAS